MKNNITNLSITIAFLAVVACQFILNHKHVKRLESELAIEAAKTNFIFSKAGGENVFYDRIYAKNDTIAFYRNDSLMGMTVTVTD